MKKRLSKRLQQLMALVLIAAMLWQTDSLRYFGTAYAAETESTVIESTDASSENELSENAEAVTDEDIPITVLGEVESLRTQDEKHFRMSDGSFMAVSYGMPVHYQDAEGDWQDIDNRMVLSEDQAVYETYNLQSNTSFASSLSEGILFETSYGDTSVSMSLLDTTSANLLMQSITTPITVPQQSTSVLSSEVVPVAGQEVQIQTLNQEILTEISESELLVFDRTTIADTSVEAEDILSASGSLSASDDSNKGWTMEDWYHKISV